MADVFISYSTKNSEEARTIRGVLVQNGFSVFMAPDSIPGGSNYTKEIPAAIKQCKVFLLLLSRDSQQSIWVSAEVENAFKHEKLIVPFLIENCPINDDFDFLLSRSQRIEAYEKKTEALESLVDRLKAVLKFTKQEDKPVRTDDNRLNTIEDLVKPAPVAKPEHPPVEKKPAPVVKPEPAPIEKKPASNAIEFNGDLYEGETLDGIPHGKGTMTYRTGAVHEGCFEKGKPHGKGKHTTSNGIVYEGVFVEGRREGMFKISYPFGLVFEGEVVNGVSHGKGKTVYTNGCVYEGDYFEGKVQGKGKFTYPSGLVYEGDFYNGRQHGNGIRTYPDGRRTRVEMSESKLISESDI